MRTTDDRPPFVSVVVPAYNEAARIAHTIDAIRTALQGQYDDWELIVADDGSIDETARIARVAGADDPRVRVLTLAHAGKGAAVRQGMLYARGTWRLLSDADLSTPVSELQRLFEVAHAERADIVIGSREGLGATRVDEPWYRHAIGRVFNWAVKLAVMRGIDDTQCGFKLIRAAAADAVFPLQRIDGFGFDVEVLYLARRAGFVVRQVPVMWIYHRSSKVTMSTGLSGFVDIARVRWHVWSGAYDR